MESIEEYGEIDSNISIESIDALVLSHSTSVREVIKENISTEQSKTIIERMKDRLSEDELIGLIVQHAKNPSASLSKPFIFFIAEKYGIGLEGGLGGYVESGFLGVEKDKDWEIED